MFYLELEGLNLERWETSLGQGLDMEGWTPSLELGTIISLDEQEESEWYRNKPLHKCMCHARQVEKVEMLKIPSLLSPENLCLKKF